MCRNVSQLWLPLSCLGAIVERCLSIASISSTTVCRMKMRRGNFTSSMKPNPYSSGLRTTSLYSRYTHERRCQTWLWALVLYDLSVLIYRIPRSNLYDGVSFSRVCSTSIVDATLMKFRTISDIIRPVLQPCDLYRAFLQVSSRTKKTNAENSFGYGKCKWVVSMSGGEKK